MCTGASGIVLVHALRIAEVPPRYYDGGSAVVLVLVVVLVLLGVLAAIAYGNRR
jgi:hypothetical protein